MQLFALRGFSQPTMDEVAAAAGVQKPTLYAYFDGKSALIDAVIDKLLCERPVLRLAERDLPLRQRIIDVGLQMQELAAHCATLTLAIGLAEIRLSTNQWVAWQRRYADSESYLAGLLEHYCDCEQPERVAQLFRLLAVSDLRPETAVQNIKDPSRIESAVDLLLRAYPQR